jgi:trimeric autotransporter adhesin
MIIHSPIVSGSLTFASGATFALPAGGVYSGSFSGSITGIGDPATFSASLENKISQLKVDTGSQDARLDLLESYTSSQDTKNSTISTYTSSLETKNSTLATYTGSVDTKFSTLGNLSGSYATTGSNLFRGDQIVSGSFELASTASVFRIEGNIFSQTYLTSNGALVLNPGFGGVEMTGANRSFKATDITADGFVSGEIRANNGVVSGSSQIVGILSPLNTFSASEESKNSTLATYTGSIDTKNNTLGTYTASLETKNSTLATYTGSVDTKNSTLATYTSSVDTKFTTLGSLSGSFSRTNSANTFNGNQTISGSLYITQDLVVQGSSSIQNVSSSVLNIGTNLITVATNQPSVRFGGIAVVDSGSAGGSGSFLYDSVQDEFIFVHRGNGTNVTSSHFVMGPETIDNLGNEIYLTNNRVLKGTGKEHIVDSNITDTGTLITLGSNTVVSGTIVATGTTLVSGSAQIAFSGVTGTVSNAQLANSTISGKALGTNLDTLTIGTGLSGTSYNGSSAVTIANTGVTSNVAGTGVSVSGATGAVTISIGQSVATSANAQFNSLGIGMAASATAGRIDATNDIVAYSSSDIRFKENITPIENALEKISKISGNTYDWKEENKVEHGYEGSDVGVIAQEIEEVLPQLVQTRENGYKAVKYDKLVALLIEGIKEQQSQIEELRNKINKLENGL